MLDPQEDLTPNFCGPLSPLGYLSNRSAVFARGAEGKMPRINDRNLDGVAFMYRTADEARARVRLGGTGFVVGRPIPDSARAFGKTLFLTYLISNRHVVFEGSACVATVNRKDGGQPSIWEFDQEDWIAHPNGDDLAAACAYGKHDRAVDRLSFIEESSFITQSKIDDLHIGVGDDVFMIGRFVNLQGTDTNLPALRFGNVSVMPSEIRTKGPGGPRMQLGYAVEMRSRTGFSGSPVCVYRAANSALTTVPESADNFWGLLGVNWGYVKDEEGENTWLNGVVPAWKILELLETPALRAHFDFHTAQVAKVI